MHKLALALALLFPPAVAAQEDEAGFGPIFNGKDFTGIKFQLPKADQDPAKTFSVEEETIAATGRPNGYWYTEKDYKEFVLRFDFRYKKPEKEVDEAKWGGNSGYLLFIEPPHKVWPKCVEVQGMNKDVLMLIPLGVKSRQTFEDKEARSRVRKPLGEWNSVEIVSKGGVITSSLNGTKISVIEAPDAKPGAIAFQSEGAPISWRKVRIKAE